MDNVLMIIGVVVIVTALGIFWYVMNNAGGWR